MPVWRGRSAPIHADRVTTLAIASVPHPAAFASAYKSSEDGGADGQHARSGYMRDIISLPRGQIEEAFLANDRQVMQLLFAGLPEDSVQEYLEIVGNPEGMRGCLDWYRAGALPQEPGTPGAVPAEYPRDSECPPCSSGPTRTRRSVPRVRTPPSATSRVPTASSSSRGSATGSRKWPRIVSPRSCCPIWLHIAPAAERRGLRPTARHRTRGKARLRLDQSSESYPSGERD